MILLTGFGSTYFFHPEGGGDMFLQNLGWNSTDYSASYPRRWYCLPVWAQIVSSSLKMLLRNVGWNSTGNMRIGYLHRLLLPSYFPGSHCISYMSLNQSPSP
jgi:hypothetical protein